MIAAMSVVKQDTMHVIVIGSKRRAGTQEVAADLLVVVNPTVGPVLGHGQEIDAGADAHIQTLGHDLNQGIEAGHQRDLVQDLIIEASLQRDLVRSLNVGAGLPRDLALVLDVGVGLLRDLAQVLIIEASLQRDLDQILIVGAGLRRDLAQDLITGAGLQRDHALGLIIGADLQRDLAQVLKDLFPDLHLKERDLAQVQKRTNQKNQEAASL